MIDFLKKEGGFKKTKGSLPPYLTFTATRGSSGPKSF